MADTVIRRLGVARGRDLRRSVGRQLTDMREERGLSQREICRAIGIDRSWLARAEHGEANLTLDALASLVTALGAQPSLRLYPAAGPRLRDHLQVQLLEALLGVLHARWRPR